MIPTKENKNLRLYENFEKNSFLYCFYRALNSCSIMKTEKPVESHWVSDQRIFSFTESTDLENIEILKRISSMNLSQLKFISAYCIKQTDVCDKIFSIHIDGRTPPHMHMYKPQPKYKSTNIKEQNIFHYNTRYSKAGKRHYPDETNPLLRTGFKITQKDLNYIKQNNLDFKLDELLEFHNNLQAKCNEIRSYQGKFSSNHDKLYSILIKKFSKTLNNVSTFLDNMNYKHNATNKHYLEDTKQTPILQRLNNTSNKYYFEDNQKPPLPQDLNNPINKFNNVKIAFNTKQAIMRLIDSKNTKQPEVSCYEK